MKKITFILTLMLALIAAIIFISYRTFTQKQVAPQVKVLYVNRNINGPQNTANVVLQETANVQEWEIFKREYELKIKDQEILIDKLNLRVNEQAQKFDARHKRKIACTEQQIKYMKTRLENYEKGPGNWGSFKLQFSNEIDAIENVLKDLTGNNKNQEYPK